VTTAIEAVTEAAKVATAAAGVHVARGGVAAVGPLGEVVGDVTGAGRSLWAVVSDTTIEVVRDESTDAAATAVAVAALAAAGWRVVVLVASQFMGDAHRALRGLPCRLQQWWFEADEVAFGVFEVP
jgi:hypothetical protein